GRIEERIRNEPALAAEVAAAHRAAVAERKRRLSPEEREMLAVRSHLDDLLATGLGGIADRSRVKCLHLHVAHELAAANPIGRIVLAKISESACPAAEVICSAA
ncbi:MAG: DUF501 domain-containing protein, partial [Candidatus Bipolaricaulota bacterium]